jgi:hypothetical protein
VPRKKYLRSTEPKTALSETVEFNMTLTAVREEVGVEGGHAAGRRSPPAVPRTRRSTSDHRERDGPGRRREEGVHFSFTTLL